MKSLLFWIYRLLFVGVRGTVTLSRLTGVPYSIVQRATSDTVRYGSMVCESLPGDEEYETYIDETEYEKFPEY